MARSELPSYLSSHTRHEEREFGAGNVLFTTAETDGRMRVSTGTSTAKRIETVDVDNLSDDEMSQISPPALAISIADKQSQQPPPTLATTAISIRSGSRVSADTPTAKQIRQIDIVDVDDLSDDEMFQPTPTLAITVDDKQSRQSPPALATTGISIADEESQPAPALASTGINIVDLTDSSPFDVAEPQLTRPHSALGPSIKRSHQDEEEQSVKRAQTPHDMAASKRRNIRENPPDSLTSASTSEHSQHSEHESTSSLSSEGQASPRHFSAAALIAAHVSAKTAHTSAAEAHASAAAAHEAAIAAVSLLS